MKSVSPPKHFKPISNEKRGKMSCPDSLQSLSVARQNKAQIEINRRNSNKAINITSGDLISPLLQQFSGKERATVSKENIRPIAERPSAVTLINRLKSINRFQSLTGEDAQTLITVNKISGEENKVTLDSPERQKFDHERGENITAKVKRYSLRSEIQRLQTLTFQKGKKRKREQVH